MEEVKREAVIRRILAGKLAVDDAALLLGVFERQVWRLRARFLAAGAGCVRSRQTGVASGTLRR